MRHPPHIVPYLESLEPDACDGQPHDVVPLPFTHARWKFFSCRRCGKFGFQRVDPDRMPLKIRALWAYFDELYRIVVLAYKDAHVEEREQHDVSDRAGEVPPGGTQEDAGGPQRDG